MSLLSKINTKKVFWPQEDSGFCALATQKTAKITQERLKDHWSQEIWPPSSKDYNPEDYFMWSEVVIEANKQPHNTLTSLSAKISEVMAYKDREVVIHPCRRLQPRDRGCLEAGGNLMK
jgi:hypothetical protein